MLIFAFLGTSPALCSYVAYMWRKSVQPIVALSDVTGNGWLATGEINWIDEAFPEEIKLILSMTVIKEISMKNMKKVLHLKRSCMEAKLIAMLMTMTFYFMRP